MPAKKSPTPPVPAPGMEERLRDAETALQEARDALAHVRAELERRVAELEAQIAARIHLESELLKVSEREKRHFGQDLHDETCQGLAGLSLLARVIARELGDSSAPVREKVLVLSEQLRELVEQTRRIASGLYPVSLSGGLLPVLRELTTRIHLRLPCLLKVDETITVSEEEALALYRIAQEAANNALRHAQASRIEITLERTPRGVSLSVRDNGIGIDPDAPQMGTMGLAIMRCRAASVAAELQVQSRQPAGTEVCCVLPEEVPAAGHAAEIQNKLVRAGESKL